MLYVTNDKMGAAKASKNQFKKLLKQCGETERVINGTADRPYL